MNFSGVTLNMSFKEAQELDAIIKRDKAKAIIKHEYTTPISGTKLSPSYLCPTCKEVITYVNGEFCPFCGQRLDRENVAL